MPLYSGQQGKLYVDGVEAARVQNWSFSSNQAVLDTTCLGDTDRTLIAGVRSISGQARLLYYRTAANADSTVSVLIDKCIATGTGEGDGENAMSTSGRFKLWLNDGTSAGKFIEFGAWITSVSMAMTVGEVFGADVSFEGNGAPTSVTL